MKKDLLSGLSEEQIAKVKACKSNEELLKLAMEEGIELSEEQLSAINGGMCTSIKKIKCPTCGSHDTEVWNVYEKGTQYEYFRVHCNACNTNFMFN